MIIAIGFDGTICTEFWPQTGKTVLVWSDTHEPVEGGE